MEYSRDRQTDRHMYTFIQRAHPFDNKHFTRTAAQVAERFGMQTWPDGYRFCASGRHGHGRSPASGCVQTHISLNARARPSSDVITIPPLAGWTELCRANQGEVDVVGPRAVTWRALHLTALGCTFRLLIDFITAPAHTFPGVCACVMYHSRRFWHTRSRAHGQGSVLKCYLTANFSIIRIKWQCRLELAGSAIMGPLHEQREIEPLNLHPSDYADTIV